MAANNENLKILRDLKQDFEQVETVNEMIENDKKEI